MEFQIYHFYHRIYLRFSLHSANVDIYIVGGMVFEQRPCLFRYSFVANMRKITKIQSQAVLTGNGINTFTQSLLISQNSALLSRINSVIHTVKCQSDEDHLLGYFCAPSTHNALANQISTVLCTNDKNKLHLECDDRLHRYVRGSVVYSCRTPLLATFNMSELAGGHTQTIEENAGE